MIHKFLFSFVAAFLVLVILAPNASAETYRAVVINDAMGGCGAIGIDENSDPDSPWYPFVLVKTQEGKRLVASHSRNGNFTLVCKVKGVPNTTGRAWTTLAEDLGLPCGTITPHGMYFTFDYTYTLTPSGIATNTCRFKFPE